jgi:hypothetical protein
MNERSFIVKFHSDSGERRLPACAIRQPAELRIATESVIATTGSRQSCRELQAGSLCSPQKKLAPYSMLDVER